MELVHELSLRLQRQHLVETLQSINFGRLDHLRLRDDRLFIDAKSQIVREHKFAAENGPRAELQKADFTLKQQLIELFAYFDTKRCGEIETLEVNLGLPFRMIVIDSAV